MKHWIRQNQVFCFSSFVRYKDASASLLSACPICWFMSMVTFVEGIPLRINEWWLHFLISSHTMNALRMIGSCCLNWTYNDLSVLVPIASAGWVNIDPKVVVAHNGKWQMKGKLTHHILCAGMLGVCVQIHPMIKREISAVVLVVEDHLVNRVKKRGFLCFRCF